MPQVRKAKMSLENRALDWVSVWVSLCPECGMCLPDLQSCFLLGEHCLIHLLFYSHTFICVFICFFIHSPMPSGHLPKPS